MCNAIRFLCYLQANILSNNWFILNTNNFIGRGLLRMLELYDLLSYNNDKKSFAESRREAVGPVFCALGRIYCVDYQSTLKVINQPQKRTTYLGRIKFSPDAIPDKIPIFLSNTNEHKLLHSKIHNLIVLYLVNKGQKTRLEDELSNDIVTHMSKTLKKSIPLLHPEKINGTCHVDFDVSIIENALLKWLFYVFLDIQLTEEQEHLLQNAMAPSRGGNLLKKKYLGQSIEDINIESLVPLIEQSSVFNDYQPSDLSKTEISEIIIYVLLIAGYLGTLNAIIAVLSVEVHGRQSYQLEFNKLKKINNWKRFILEVIRVYSPVNMINTLLEKETTMKIGNKEYTFPINTPYSCSLMSSGNDNIVYPNTETLDFNREGIEHKLLNFNFEGLGDESTDLLSNRGCPGRFLAIRMITIVLESLV